MPNKIIDNIKTRVSCREYSDKKVTKAKLLTIAECGKMAPSAVNRQICNILIVKNKNYVEKLRKLSIDVRGSDCFYGAKTMMIVYGPKDNRFLYQDASCILENIFLAANSLNINSCWINQVDELLNNPLGRKLKKQLGLNEEDCVVGTAILGYKKDETRLVVKERKADFIRIK